MRQPKPGTLVPNKVHNNCAWVVKTWDADRVIYRELGPYSFSEALAEIGRASCRERV